MPFHHQYISFSILYISYTVSSSSLISTYTQTETVTLIWDVFQVIIFSNINTKWQIKKITEYFVTLKKIKLHSNLQFCIIPSLFTRVFFYFLLFHVVFHAPTFENPLLSVLAHRWIKFSPEIKYTKEQKMLKWNCSRRWCVEGIGRQMRLRIHMILR